MKTCEWCGKRFDEAQAADYFNSEMYRLSYDKIQKCLCGECAVQAINDDSDEVYFETCHICGRTFDFVTESLRFDNSMPYGNGTRLIDYWDSGALCTDCALEQIEEQRDENSDFDEYDEDDEDDERLSVEDAALAWLSSGRDEDHTLGYTEEELENALRNR